MEKENIIDNIQERLGVLESIVYEREEQLRQAYDNFEERLKGINIVYKIRTLLQHTLESTTEGILVVDNNGKVSLYNKKFLELWNIPATIIINKDDKELLNFVSNQLADPNEFLNKVKELYASPGTECFDKVLFKDGRVFRRCSKSLLVDDEVVGRVWSFTDITEEETATF